MVQLLAKKELPQLDLPKIRKNRLIEVLRFIYFLFNQDAFLLFHNKIFFHNPSWLVCLFLSRSSHYQLVVWGIALIVRRSMQEGSWDHTTLQASYRELGMWFK